MQKVHRFLADYFCFQRSTQPFYEGVIMRSFLKSIQSSLNRKIEKRIKRKRLIKEFSNLSNQDVFEKIYHEKLWGGSDSDEGFYSGQGSHKLEIVEPYIKKVKEFIMQNNDIKLPLILAVVILILAQNYLIFSKSITRLMFHPQ